MKINIEVDDSLVDVEITIKTSYIDENIIAIQNILKNMRGIQLVFYKENEEYYLPLQSIIFFETYDNKIYGHTIDNFYEVRLKLYELEKCLPYYFCRISKSAIVNVKEIYSLEKSFSGSSRIKFYNTDKQTIVSRHYNHYLKEKLIEVR